MTIGSLGSKKDDQYSDIDLVLVCDNDGIPSSQDRIDVINFVSDNKATLDSINLKIWNFGTADDFTIENQEVCTQFFTKNYLEEKVNLTINGFYNQIGMEHPLASLSSLLNAKVHIDKDGFYEDIRSKIDPYPETLRNIILEQEINMRFPYYLNRLETAVKREDIPFACKMISQAVDSAVYVLFAQYRTFPNGPKRLFQQLDDMATPELAGELKRCFTKIFTLETTKATLPEKQAILNELLILLKQGKGATISNEKPL